MSESRRRVLVVDDEPKITEVVSSYLRREGFEPIVAASGAEALRIAEREAPCLVILDLMLPDLPGEEVCRRLRSSSPVPIIMLTARVQDGEVVRGLALGADDYVTKPFSPRQLMARVGAVLRRTLPQRPPALLEFCDGDLVIDTEAKTARKGGEPVNLTAREFRILEALAEGAGRVLSRERLVSRALGEDFTGLDRTIDAHVKNLRQKIESDPRSPRYVLTVHGVGYRFGPEASR